ncbi:MULTISPECIES: O-antigen ligase [unclassified Fusibacter]|uniref:O-antigen ligase family protein n=1 Tax=unclassified Fusibacter TaxID=2624464 RepID=UPI0013E9654C|nr:MULTISPECIES: O-antigen ligase family protein [unclassified Fusibacter]MCK8061254.1 O-antigen ligase family protein [Fusibacter sp. A2]NPE23402.1 O-antigen ligase family protein [Fusibacter sp. A1]
MDIQVAEYTEKENTRLPLVFLIFVALFPILPSYFRILGYSSYTLLTVVCTVLLFILKPIKFMKIKVPYKYFFLILIIFMLRTIPIIVHGEFSRVLLFIVDDVIPIFIVYIFVNSDKKFQKVTAILLVVASLISISGIVEFMTQFNVFSLIENFTYDNPNLGTKSSYRLDMFRIEQSFNNSISYAIYLSFCLYLAYYKIMIVEKKYRKLLVYALILLNINIFLTLARGPIIIMIIGQLLFMVNLLLNLKTAKWKKTVVVLIIVCGVVISANYLSIGKVFNMIASTIGLNTGTNYMAEDTISYRIELIRIVFEGIKENIVFGLGIYGKRDFNFFSTINNISGNFSSVDNNYLGMMLKYGIFGLLGFIITYLSTILHAIKNRNKTNILERVSFNKFYIIIMTLYLLNLLNVAQMADARISYIFIGLLLSYNRIYNNLIKNRVPNEL